MTLKLTSAMLLSICTLSACSHTTHSSTLGSEARVTTYDFAYKAFGNEPNWMVDISKDNTLTFSTPESKGIKLQAQRSAFAKGMEYMGTYEGQNFTLVINGKRCSDTMSDKTYDMTAIFDFAGQTYNGCAMSK